MSEESNTSEGFVIEGDIDVAVKGHLALYSIVGGRIGYLPYATRAQELGLSERYVPAPRKAQDAFARAKDVLHNMSVPTLDTLEGWDGPVVRKIVVKPLKKGSEYAVSIEHSVEGLEVDDTKPCKTCLEFRLTRLMGLIRTKL